MLDVKLIRDNSDVVRDGLKKRQKDPGLVDVFLSADRKWRALILHSDESRARLNVLSEERNIEQAREQKITIKNLEAEIKDLEKERDALLRQFPNIPAPDVPVGKNESENKVLREVGEKPKFDFEPKDYLTIGERLGIIDVKKASEVSGTRFGYLKGDAVLWEFALVRLALDVLIKKGFIPIIPPVMIKPEVFAGMGRLTADQKDERYYIPSDDVYLIGSAEHTLGPLHMNETLRAADLPRRYVGFSTCFRREAGSYGKDTKGILRVHQFDKVEMFSFSAPEKSEEEHQFLLSCQEELMQKLELAYRVVQICAGDLGWTDAKQYDIETWLPGQNIYRETHSCSNTTDFQARGINCKYEKGAYVHMLNATAFAIGRMIIALIENYQQKDGSVRAPL